MTKTHPTNPYNKGIGAILVAVTLATIAALIIWAVAISMGAENPEKDALIANIEAGYPENAENVTEAFKLWGFPAFNKTMVFNVEACYHNSYYKELPSNDELAKKAADHFIKTYYDNIDLSNKEAVTHGLANSFIHAVGDRYGVYRTKEEQESYSSGLAGELVGIGVMVSKSEEGLIHVNSPIKNSPAEAAGIIAGDIIIAVDGTLVADVGYDAGSNLISGKEGTTVIIKVLRDSQELEFSIVRSRIEEVAVTYEMLEGNIGYISISRFISPTAEQFAQALSTLESDGARGIIFDLRSNPGGLLSSVVSVLSYIAPTGTELVSFSSGSLPKSASHGTNIEPYDHIFTLPSVVLINGHTASAGELFTAAMRDFNMRGNIDVTIMGQTSYGKGVMQSSVSFTGGSALTLTTDLYNPPSGINYDGVGIFPNKELDPTQDPLPAALAEIEALLSGSSDGGIGI